MPVSSEIVCVCQEGSRAWPLRLVQIVTTVTLAVGAGPVSGSQEPLSSSPPLEICRLGVRKPVIQIQFHHLPAV